MPFTTPQELRHSLKPLGLSGPAEVVYRSLLRQPHTQTAVLHQLIRSLGEAPDAMVADLEARGLIHRKPGADDSWLASKPGVAIELLLMERQAELNQARLVLPELEEELARESSTAAATDVQVLSEDPQAQLRAYLQMYSQAQSSLHFLVLPPFLVSSPEAMSAARAAARNRGVRIRTIVAPELLRQEGWRAAALQAIAAGEECRVLDGLPFKLAVADGRRAMLPLRLNDPAGPALQLGDVAVIVALDQLFERYWSQAVEISPDTGSDPSASVLPGEAAEELASLRELAMVLAAGTNDKGAAYALGISERTLQRRISALSTHLRARSRFQAGWLAALGFARSP